MPGNSTASTVCPAPFLPTPNGTSPAWYYGSCPGSHVTGYFALAGLILYLVFFSPGMGYARLIKGMIVMFVYACVCVMCVRVCVHMQADALDDQRVSVPT